jgi:hypothetical protein
MLPAFCCSPGCARPTRVATPRCEIALFDAIASECSGEAAQENTRQIVQYHRIQEAR